MNRIVFDLQMSAAKAGYYLRCYRVDVDVAGYDLVIDWGTGNARLQVKTVLRGSKKTSWKVQQRLLMPSLEQMRDFAWDWAAHPGQKAGGVLLANFNWDDRFQTVSYDYTDLYLLALRGFGWNGSVYQTRAAQKVIVAVASSKKSTRIELPRTTLVAPRNTDCLLALIGAMGIIKPNWRRRFIEWRTATAKSRDRIDLVSNVAIANLELAELCSNVKALSREQIEARIVTRHFRR